MHATAEWIADPGELTGWLDRSGAGPLALDTEADSLHHYPEKICLIQLSRDGRNALVDPLDGFDAVSLAASLSPILGDRGIRKILHGADYDLRMLSRDMRIELHGLFDTMVAARLAGERSFGLAALLDRHLDVRLDKRFQRADWSERPLSAEMRDYAVMDTAYLAELTGLLEARLVELGRLEWANEEFRRLETVRYTETSIEEAFRRVKGSAKLERPALAVLRELYRLRDEVARELDRPPFKVLRDDLLLALARQPATAPPTLRGLPGLPRRWERPSWRGRLLDTVQRARALPSESWPEIRSERRQRPGPAREKRVKRLARARDGVAEELGLEPSVVAPRAILERIIDALEEGGDWREVDGLRRWQAEQLAPVVADEAD